MLVVRSFVARLRDRRASAARDPVHVGIVWLVAPPL
jgi:hypothetical protein